MYEEEDDFEDEDLEFEENSGEGNTIQINLPRPHKGQQLVLNSTARYKILLCGRRWGKTLISQIIAINAMLEKEKVAYVTPEYGLAKEFFKNIINLLPPTVIRKTNKAELYIELITGGDIKFFSGENLDAFRGRKFNKVIIDEAAFIPNLHDAWYGSIRPTLSDLEGDAIFISTPRGQNFFYSLYLKGKHKEKGYESWHFATSDNPYFPKSEFEEQKASMPRDKFREEFLAIPNENSSNPFGAENIAKNVITELSIKPTLIYGIDVASHKDWSVIIGLDEDGAMTYFDRFKLTWEQTVNRILNLPTDVLKVIDSTGVGDVLFETLRSGTANIQGFKFTAQSKPAIINQLVNEVQKGTVKYNDVTAQELNTFEGKRTSSGYIKYEAQAGFHDDCVCALAIAAHHKYIAFSNSSWQLYTV